MGGISLGMMLAGVIVNRMGAERVAAWKKSLLRKVGRMPMKTRIQELRKQRKLSQEELALEVGVTRQTIISIEREKYTASLNLAYKIAKFFGLTIEEVFDLSSEEE